MSNANTAAKDFGDSVETIDTVIEAQVSKGPFTRLGNLVRRNPVASVLTGVAVGVGGYFSYIQLRDRGDLDGIIGTAETTANVINGLWK